MLDEKALDQAECGDQQRDPSSAHSQRLCTFLARARVVKDQNGIRLAQALLSKLYLEPVVWDPLPPAVELDCFRCSCSA
jgi:hypothetical protein